MALFLVSELLNLDVCEGDEQFATAQLLRECVRVGLFTIDHVLETDGSLDEHGRERYEVLPIKWSRLRRHDFHSYRDQLHRELYGMVEKSPNDFSGGVQGAQPPCPKQVASEACPSGASCTSLKCAEDGVCRRTGDRLDISLHK